MRSPITIAIDLYRFIQEEKEDRKLKHQISRWRFWSRWWASIGDAMNLAIWDGAWESAAMVKDGMRKMEETLKEVDEGERLVEEAGVVIKDPRRAAERRAGKRKVREVVKSGALKFKGYVWLDRHGTRSAEHRRELWMHTDGEVDALALNDVWVEAAQGLTEAHAPLVELVQRKEEEFIERLDREGGFVTIGEGFGEDGLGEESDAAADIWNKLSEWNPGKDIRHLSD